MTDNMTTADWLRAEAEWGKPCLHDPTRLEEAADSLEHLLAVNADLLAALEAMNRVQEGYCICPLLDGELAVEFHTTICADARTAVSKARGE